VLGRAWKRGVLDGHRGWLIAGAVALVVRWLRRGGQPEVVYREELAPGESLVIAHLPEGTGTP